MVKTKKVLIEFEVAAQAHTDVALIRAISSLIMNGTIVDAFSQAYIDIVLTSVKVSIAPKQCATCGSDWLVSCDEAGDPEEQHKVACGKHWHCENCGHTWDKNGEVK